jgi:HD-like signal output (HDOD) protein
LQPLSRDRRNETDRQDAMLDHPLRSATDYVNFLSGANLPVLRHTRRQLEAAYADVDRVTARDLSTIILQDPLMAVKVLYYIQPFRGKALRTDITTVGSAIMMLGIDPFFRKFADLTTVEERLAEHPEAVLGAVKTIRRVQRAAEWAYDWAIWRHDLNVEEVTMATLLHDLAEILCWCFAPQLMLEIRRRQLSVPSVRSSEVQQDVLGVTLYELQRELSRAWHLPELLQHLTNDNAAEEARVRNVVLAVNLARHTAKGWDDAALPDDYLAIAGLLNVSAETVMERVGAPPAAPDNPAPPASPARPG